MQHSAELTEGAGTAITAESLYLVNLLLAPGLGFLPLLWMWWRSREQAPPLAASHLSQTLSGSLWAGMLLVVANGLILLLGGYRGPHVWVVVITYFTFVTDAGDVRCLWPFQGDGRPVLALPADWAATRRVAAGLSRRWRARPCSASGWPFRSVSSCCSCWRRRWTSCASI